MSCITADVKSYWHFNIFKSFFEDYRDAKENAFLCLWEHPIYIWIDWESSAFAVVLLLFSLLYSSVFRFCMDPVSTWTYLARLLYLVLADTLQNSKCKAKLQVSSAAIIYWNLLVLAVGFLLISSLPMHMVYTEGTKYTLELAGRNCCQ